MREPINIPNRHHLTDGRVHQLAYSTGIGRNNRQSCTQGLYNRNGQCLPAGS